MRTVHIFFIIIYFIATWVQGQRILQIEDPKEVKAIRYFEGQKLTFRSVLNGDEWQTKKIKKILVEESVIVFDQDFIHINQITHVRENIAIRQIIGKILTTFGSAWLLYGGIAIVFGLPNVVARDLLIGGVAIVSGWLIQRLSRKVYTMGKNGRIRLLDISFPAKPSP